MVPYRNKLTIPFFILALSLLAFGLLFGLLGALEYVIPGFSKNFLSFEKIRPLHVSSAVFWILTAIFAGLKTAKIQHDDQTNVSLYNCINRSVVVRGMQ